jgi:hypothetical protein
LLLIIGSRFVVLSSLAIALIVVLGVLPQTWASLPSSTVSTCQSSQLANQTMQISSQIDANQELKSASQTPIFIGANRTHAVVEESTTNTWSINAGCLVSLSTAGVVFSTMSSSGVILGSFQVIESANLSTVLESGWISQNTTASMCGGLSDCWSGWDIYDPGVNYGYTGMSWEIPPATVTTKCGSGCTEKVDVWSGQTVDFGGGGTRDGIAQTGTDSSVSVYCVIFCTAIAGYSIWYELYPAVQNTCFTGTSFPGAGNNMEATTDNEGGDSYYTFIEDTSISYACTSHGTIPSMGGPATYYEFMMENPEDDYTGTPWQGPDAGVVTISQMEVQGQGPGGFPQILWNQMPNDVVNAIGHTGSLGTYFTEDDSGCAC